MKTLKIVHQFNSLLQLLGNFIPQAPYGGFAAEPHWGLQAPWSGPNHVNPLNYKIMGTRMATMQCCLAPDSYAYHLNN